MLLEQHLLYKFEKNTAESNEACVFFAFCES
jgi:hypothetical protein